MNLAILKKELQRVKKLGFIQTHRTGDTGIGKTLEDLLHIFTNDQIFEERCRILIPYR